MDTDFFVILKSKVKLKTKQKNKEEKGNKRFKSKDPKWQTQHWWPLRLFAVAWTKKYRHATTCHTILRLLNYLLESTCCSARLETSTTKRRWSLRVPEASNVLQCSSLPLIPEDGMCPFCRSTSQGLNVQKNAFEKELPTEDTYPVAGIMVLQGLFFLFLNQNVTLQRNTTQLLVRPSEIGIR